MEKTQAEYWGNIVTELVITRSADAIPGQDNRRYGIDPDPYQKYEFPRVDSNGNLQKDGPVQMIRIEGPVMKYDFCGAMGMESLQQGLRSANADSTVQSIVLLIDSPGGTVDGTDNLAKEVSNSKKPVVSFVNGMMCSAAYWIGSGAKEIVVDDANKGYNAYVGSIGTMAMWKDTTKADEQKGVKTNIVTATKSTRKTSYSDQVAKGDYTRLIKELDNINETFHSAIQQNRGGKLKMDKENLFEGDFYDGKDAVKYGLADKIASLPYAIKRSLQLAKTIS